MPRLEERVAYLEGRLEDHTRALGELRGELHGLREDMGRRFDAVDGRFEAIDQKVDRHFTWLVGVQVASLVAVLGALAGSFYK